MPECIQQFYFKKSELTSGPCIFQDDLCRQIVFKNKNFHKLFKFLFYVNCFKV